jgi:glucosyl-3-phosphoglycerate synthase
MGDFYQTGAIATFHRLGLPKLEKIEKELKTFSKWRPIALVLPALFDELQGEALPLVLDELRKVHYLRQIVVSLDRADAEQFAFAKQFFRKLNHDCKIIWQDGPRLVYPVASPNLPYEFCKGYYSRVTDRMHGRVTRLLVTPLIHALKTIAGPLPYLNFMDSFRYALAGEFALLTELARVIRIPGDWGLEVGLLSEVFHNVTVRRVCQIDIIDQYEHKHNQLSPNNPQEGFLKMCIDIAKSIFRNSPTKELCFPTACCGRCKCITFAPRKTC